MRHISGNTRSNRQKNNDLKKKGLHLYIVCGKLLMLRIKRWSSGTSHGKDDVEVLRTSKE